MPTRSSDFSSAPVLEGQGNPDVAEPEAVLREVLGGRYSVEVNIDGITDGVPGEWENFSHHDTIGDAIRAASAFLELTKQLLGVDSLNDGVDGRIEPWIRSVDHWDEVIAVWVEGGVLHVREEEE